MKKPIIIFFGSPPFSATILQALLDSKKYQIVTAVTQPDRPVGRQQKLTPTPVKTLATNHQLPVITATTMKAIRYQLQPTLNPLPQQKPDLIILAAYGPPFLDKKMLALPRSGALNLHPSLLPAYRGAAPIAWPILTAEKETGVTLMKMSLKIDQGKIISQKKVAISPIQTRQSLTAKLARTSAQLLLDTIPDWLAGKIKATPQPPTSPTPYARRLTRQEGYIPFPLIQKALAGNDIAKKSKPSLFTSVPGTWPQAVERAIRALHPWPGVWTIIPAKTGEKRLKILSAKIKNKKLILNQVQPEGKTPTSFNSIKSLISHN